MPAYMLPFQNLARLHFATVNIALGTCCKAVSNALYTWDAIHFLTSKMISGDPYSSPNVTVKGKYSNSGKRIETSEGEL